MIEIPIWLFAIITTLAGFAALILIAVFITFIVALCERINEEEDNGCPYKIENDLYDYNAETPVRREEDDD